MLTDYYLSKKFFYQKKNFYLLKKTKDVLLSRLWLHRPCGLEREECWKALTMHHIYLLLQIETLIKPFWYRDLGTISRNL